MAKKKKPEPPKLTYTLEEANEVSGIGKHEIRALIHKKKIKYNMEDGYIVINKIEFDNYLNENKV